VFKADVPIAGLRDRLVFKMEKLAGLPFSGLKNIFSFFCDPDGRKNFVSARWGTCIGRSQPETCARFRLISGAVV
jgi:hypothetical protein